jgi:hypothetical protein
MGRAVILVGALVLAACGDVRGQHAERAVAQNARDMGFKAASETARDFTGDLWVGPNAVNFTKGARLATRTLAPRSADELAARGGDSFAAIALSTGDLEVEVREITAMRLLQGAPSLCAGDLAPSYVALVYGRRDTLVTVIIFTGADEPSPNARDSHVCGAYAYAAPDGARTRQGVVL